MNDLIKKGNVVKITMSGGQILYGGISDNSEFYIYFLNQYGSLNNISIPGIKEIEEYELVSEEDKLFGECFKLYQERESLRGQLEELAELISKKSYLINQQKIKMKEFIKNRNLSNVSSNIQANVSDVLEIEENSLDIDENSSNEN